MTAADHRDARRKVVKARSHLVLDHPFFGHLSLRMRLREDRTCDTAWSDGRTLAYNPHYVLLLPDEKVRGLLGHVVLHTACRHHLRRKGRSRKWWNMACDYAINWILLEAGFSLPDGYLDDARLRGRSADEIYARLFDGPPPAEARGQQQQHVSHDGEDAFPQEGEEADDPADGGRRDTGDEQGASREAPSGTAGDEVRRSEEALDGHGDPGRSGEVRDAAAPEGGTTASAEDDAAQNEWRIALAQALNQAKSMGDLPASLQRLIREQLNPKLDWRRLLSRYIQAAVRNDFAWMPPNRRYLHRGFYLPSMRSDDLQELVVAIDTSGSISEDELDQFAAELGTILETSALTVHLLYCDTRVARVETFGRQDLPLALRPTGGGGTDFRPAFQWVERRGTIPRCLIYLTDLECTRYPREPPYPVFWVHTTDMPARPPFGETIHLA